MLAHSATGLWVLPAWLRGTPEHLPQLAEMHLEKTGVQLGGEQESLDCEVLAKHDTGNLVRLTALKERDPVLEPDSPLPTECASGAECLPLPPQHITIWRELDRLVVAVTHEGRLLYWAPLTSAELDANAFAEIEQMCLQLSFQNILTKLDGIMVWGGEPDQSLAKLTQLEIFHQPKPAPRPPAVPRRKLVPAPVRQELWKQARRGRQRVLGLGIGLMAAGVMAFFAVMTSRAAQERDLLRHRLVSLSPVAAKVEQQKKLWEEVAPVLDPERFPMETLLRCMEPQTAAAITVTQFECTLTKVSMKGRAPSAGQALQYEQDIRLAKNLADYKWETNSPSIAADNSATFQLSGTRMTNGEGISEQGTGK